MARKEHYNGLKLNDVDDDKYRVDRKEFMAQFARYIGKNYGERCPDVSGGCCLCSVWAAYDLVDAVLVD